MAIEHEHRVAEWRSFFLQCMKACLDFVAFRKALEAQASRVSLAGVHVLEAWGSGHNGGFVIKPRYLRYFEEMLHSHVITDDDALRYVLRRLKVTLADQEHYLIKTGSARGEWRATIEAAILERLAYQMVNFRDATVASGDRLPDMRIFRPLMALLSTFTTMLSSSAPLNGPALEIGTELGKFVAAYMNDLSLVGLLACDDNRPPKALRKAFGRYLPPFIALIAPSSTELSDSLSMLQRDLGLHDDQQAPEQMEDGIVNDLNALTFQDGVLDLPLVPTKAAIYIYLNAMLCGRPISDNAALFTFLNARYNDNAPPLFADLISASFDVLANAVNRTEPQGSINIYRSFIANKLPVLLESLSPMIFPPLTTESCITDALNRLDPSGDPFSTQAFDPLSITGILSDARQEFLFACALHGLIAESSIESILGDVPMQSLPESGKYVKDDLVNQCSANPSKIKDLIGELENMEGNSAAIVEALVEIIQSLCSNKDTMTLKSVCNVLACKTQAMEVVFLFVEPIVILQPLCDLLERWQYQEDQSESHPVYDEFGSVLLLVLALRHHFTLQDSDLGLGPSDVFLRTYFRDARTPRRPSDLSDSERQRLGGWIKGLFEADGISDELMSACPPKDFHLLVPTLFDQSLKAFQSGILAPDTVKSGFEYLLEPFLLPSLVSGLGWAARRLWETKPAAPQLDVLIPLLTCLVKPASLSAEASALHETVLTITAFQLERALAHAQKLHPRRRDIDPLTNALRPHLHLLRNGAATHTELEAWSLQPHGGLLAALRHSFYALVSWSNRLTNSRQAANSSANGASSAAAAAAPAPAPVGSAPHYTHKLIATSVCTFGAVTTLSMLLTEATKMTAAGSCTPDVPLDILTAVVCAPCAQPARATLSLRQALQLAVQADAYTYSVGKHGEPADTARAELIVRLARRVDAQCPLRQVVPPQAAAAVAAAAAAAAAADVDSATAEIMMGLDGSDGAAAVAAAAAAAGMPDPTAMDTAASSNDMLEGMLKVVDSADLDSLMDTDGGDLFGLN